MPRIVLEKSFDGAETKIRRLGLEPIVDEIRRALSGFQLLVEERQHANSGMAVRKLIDAEFEKAGGWQNTVSGDIDWVKCKTVNGTQVCVGVEVQVSIRSDLITRDIVHFQKQLREGTIDLCVLILPSDRLGKFLTDRAPHFSAGLRIVHEMRADDLPMLFFGIEHDGPGLPLQKAITNRGKEKRRQQKPDSKKSG
jgi:hypothetical protein